ncbi:M24 family metallopeptidase, partial [Lactobacillus delbrueckii subsp. bulgaricus]|nr:X-Pro aminopeptidase [Lactobacillus delbrueckii subsp. bulgaricus]
LKDIVKFVEVDKLETIGFDNQVSFAYYQALQAIFEGYTLSPQTNFMEELRMIKDEKELATIRKACSISDRAFTDVLDFIKPGQTTELQVANFLDFRMREYGASGISFESIIAS